MKRILLTGVAALAITIGAGTRHAAKAVLGVGDITFCTNCASEFSQIASWGKQAADMARQAQQGVEMISQGYTRVQQAQAAYYAITHVSDLGTAVGALGALGIQNPLPINPFALQSLLNGSGGVQGGVSSLASLYTGNLNANRVYAPPDALGWVAQQINRQAGGIAGTQAVALQLHQSAAERTPLIAALQARISAGETTPAEREGLTNRLLAEQTYVQNQAVQAQALGAQASLLVANQEQRQVEHLQGSIEAVMSDARGRGYWTGN